jgi:hypothetical protein
VKAALALAAVSLLLLMSDRPVAAQGRTVTGTVVALDVSAGSLTIRDAAGVSWSYRAVPSSGIDLSGLRVGDRVSVTVGRPTPFNMITSADLLRKGDRVEKLRY